MGLTIQNVRLEGVTKEITVVALLKSRDAGFFQLFHASRLGINVQTSARWGAYQNRLKTDRLPEKLAEGVIACDSLLKLPSNHSWQAEPFLAALKNRFPDAVDLSARIRKNLSVKSHNNATFSQLREAYTFDQQGDEQDFANLTVVDDTFSSGNTAAAVVANLFERGLNPNCNVTFIAPLWLDRSPEIKVESCIHEEDSAKGPLSE